MAVVLSFLSISRQASRAQMIVAHRGASHAAPENTLAAFNLAWERGADAIEGDFYLTADEHIVAIHDDNTKRTSDAELQVADSTLRQLRQLDVGRWKSRRHGGERIPTLEEVLNTVPDGKKLFIEIKCGPEIVPHLKDVLSHATLEPSQTIVISFQQAVVSAVKRRIPHIKVFWLTGYKQDKSTGNWSPPLDEILATLRRTGADGLDTQANPSVVDAEFVQAIRKHGYELHAWTIDDPNVARYYQRLGVDSITTNRPLYIRKQLSR
ncbi:MAG: glycerophosphodiester phosphodiesterase [Planctomycetota bacterium]